MVQEATGSLFHSKSWSDVKVKAEKRGFMVVLFVGNADDDDDSGERVDFCGCFVVVVADF